MWWCSRSWWDDGVDIARSEAQPFSVPPSALAGLAEKLSAEVAALTEQDADG